jgi:hypothetical protein
MQIDDSAFDACGFMPWIGPDYQNGGFDGLRVLILANHITAGTWSPTRSGTQTVLTRYHPPS